MVFKGVNGRKWPSDIYPERTRTSSATLPFWRGDWPKLLRHHASLLAVVGVVGERNAAQDKSSLSNYFNTYAYNLFKPCISFPYFFVTLFPVLLRRFRYCYSALTYSAFHHWCQQQQRLKMEISPTKSLRIACFWYNRGSWREHIHAVVARRATRWNYATAINLTHLHLISKYRKAGLPFIGWISIYLWLKFRKVRIL